MAEQVTLTIGKQKLTAYKCERCRALVFPLETFEKHLERHADIDRYGKNQWREKRPNLRKSTGRPRGRPKGRPTFR